jgi:hypothetical protein
VTADSAATAAIDIRRGSGSMRFRPALRFYPQDLKSLLQSFNSMYHFDTGFYLPFSKKALISLASQTRITSY